MKTRYLSALAALALAAAPAYAQDVTFKKAGLKAGDTRAESTTSNSVVDVSFTQNGQQLQQMKQTGEEQQEKHTEVLAATDGTPTKVLVEYKKLRQVQDTPMTGRQEITDDLAGKSFILEKSGDAITVTDDKGGKIDDLTADKVKSRESALFKDGPQRFGKMLPDRPIKVGETFEVDKAAAEKALNEEGSEELKIEKMTLTLKETKTVDGVRIAVFDATLKGIVEPRGAGAQVDLKLSGPLEFGVDNSWPYRMELAGTMAFQQAQGGVVVAGSGKTTILFTAKYGRKREASGG